jgi:ribosomal protein L32
MALALWVLHTHVFGRYRVTPRLALLSPVRGCGKTTALILLEALCADPDRSDNTTAASIYHMLAEREHTLLIDEGDNLGLLNNSVLRAVFNAGHRRGGAIRRFVGGRARKFSVFAPLAVAAIGSLPLPLMHRAVVINMQRHAPSDAPLEPLDEFDPALAASRVDIQKWAETCALAYNPEMSGLNRVADNWRILIAIADDLSHGDEARATAIAMNADRRDEDAGVILLADIRTVFDGLGVDRILSVALIEALLGLDSLWNDWCGLKDDRPPRKLNPSELSRLLEPFGIGPKSIWPVPRRPDSKSRKGYRREQFEEAWAAYCPSPGTAEQDHAVTTSVSRHTGRHKDKRWKTVAEICARCSSIPP